ncbi:hypothetical protein M441DRAFT_322173 [Trichoderma asperellum CBS 433.97]|uniref:Uncharacterized protein n=1 Tax=Trichoderma asperellum (strain ATCC 204424 / CBS 433.97 / NBRC 101777) TaxID=1042311 RepID=A0A2T3ZLH9_TRIA4|nr:hypothetical protein M441DRAFT_322173 [Trichoderma asperellum CBS 433.97]PTB45659.1 hypothetical protein M441DRAFT_322173 [Trichoderma asperellum CBS 433.97]
MRHAGCTCWYCVLQISRPCLSRYSSLDQPGIDSFRLSRQPPPCLSGRSTFFYLPLPRALPPFFPILLPIFPLLHRGGAELLFVPRRPQFASPLEAALLHSKKNSIQPSIRPALPLVLASPHLPSPRVFRQAVSITGQPGWSATNKAWVSSLVLPASPSIHRPPSRLPACVLRVDHRQSALVLDSYAVKKPWQLPVIHSSTYGLFL